MEKEKGGLPRTALQGKGRRLAEYFTAATHIRRRTNLLVFLIVPFPTSLIRLSLPRPVLLRFYFLGSLSNPPSFFAHIFFPLAVRPLRPRADEKAHAQRTDGINPSRAKSKRRTVVSWASRGFGDYARQKEDCLGRAPANDC